MIVVLVLVLVLPTVVPVEYEPVIYDVSDDVQGHTLDPRDELWGV